MVFPKIELHFLCFFFLFWLAEFQNEAIWRVETNGLVPGRSVKRGEVWPRQSLPRHHAKSNMMRSAQFRERRQERRWLLKATLRSPPALAQSWHGIYEALMLEFQRAVSLEKAAAIPLAKRHQSADREGRREHFQQRVRRPCTGHRDVD